jgi:hypothetical protein
MNPIEQAIKEAVEKGGYDGERATITIAHTFDSDSSRDFRVHSTHKAFLDPSFWQALGKARGWRKINVSWFVEGAAKKLGLTKKWKEVEGEREEWVYQWHGFIDHLAEGKDAESFFAAL